MRCQRVAFYANTLTLQVITVALRPTAIYQALALDVPTAWLGALGASFALVPLLLAVPSGQAADRFGERRVMLLGAVFTVAATLMFAALAHNVWWLLAACVCLGTGHLGCVVSQQALVANQTRSSRYDTAFGHYSFVAAAGQTAGPILIVLFSDGLALPNVGAIFNCCATMSLVLLVSALFVPFRPPSGMDSTPAKGAFRRLLRRPGLLMAVTISCMVRAAVDISLIYLPVLGTARGIAAGMVGVLLALRPAASMLSRFFLGQLSARFGWTRLLSGSIGLAAVSMALLALPVPLWLLTVAVVALGLGLGCGQPLTMSWLAEAAPPGLRGRAMSLRLTGNRMGQLVIPTLAGTLAMAGGVVGVLGAAAFGLAAVGLVSRRLHPAVPAGDVDG